MINGTCLCKAVSIAVEGDFEHLSEARHCQQCRKQTGGFLMGVNVLTRIEHFRRGRCRLVWLIDRSAVRVCGSTLFQRPELEGYEWIGVSAALFDQPLLERICKHTFVADKGDYYTITDGLPQHKGY